MRTEGPAALYRGFIPAYLRLGPWNIIVSLYTYIILQCVVDFCTCTLVFLSLERQGVSFCNHISSSLENFPAYVSSSPLYSGVSLTIYLVFSHLRKVKTGVLKIQLSNHLPRPVSQDYNYTNTPRFIQSFLLFLFIAAALYSCVILSPIISVLTIMSINLLMRFSSLPEWQSQQAIMKIFSLLYIYPFAMRKFAFYAV